MEKKADQIEKSIKALPGIIGVKVVIEEDNVREVHILASGTKNPKQITRDIESAVMVDHSLKIDHKIISIAQLSDNDLIDEDKERLKIHGFSKNMSDNKTEIEVELVDGQNLYTGKRKGIITSGNKLRFFSEATLDAVEEHLGDVCNLTLNDIRLISIGRGQAVLVSVTILKGRQEEVFLGSALIKGEEELSAVKATLNAVNRRIIVLSS